MHNVHHQFWPRGVPKDLITPRVALTHYLEVDAARYPDKAAIIFGGQSWTYAQVQQRVQALAGYLQQQLGVRAGDRVLLMSQNCPQFVVAYYAILRAGAAVVPVSPMSTEQELTYYTEDSGATLIMVAQELLAPVRTVMTKGLIQQAVVHAYADAIASNPPDALPPVTLEPRGDWASAQLVCHEQAIAAGLAPLTGHPHVDSLAVLPYTSGTTGHPKGCMHTHGTVLASNLASQVWRGTHTDSVFLAVAPLFHMLGMQSGMNIPITMGSTIVMMPRWDAVSAIHLIARHKVSCWAAPPSMVMDAFTQPDAKTHDLSSLTVLSGGGAAMPEAVATMLFERFGLQYLEAYGLSETAAFLHANPPQHSKRQCLGIPTQGVQSRIIDPETLQVLPQGQVGELVTAGPQVMTGYWRNEEATRAAFITIEGQRFFRTGDLASVDEEGFFFMQDRLKRMINASGFKVWPAEVESAMYEHPAIYEACIIGINDAKRGETVKALVVLKPEYRNKVTEEDLMAWSRERMAAYKVPRMVEFLDSLPKSGTGKIMWRELQTQHNQPSQPSQPATP